MQEVAGEQGAAYIPMPKGRGFTPHFDNRFTSPVPLADALGAGRGPPFCIPPARCDASGLSFFAILIEYSIAQVF